MNRFYYYFVVLLAAVIVTVAQSHASAQEGYYPNGLHGPSDIVSGIYMGNDPASCCWLGAAGAFNLRAPYGADRLLLTVLEPDYAISGKRQSLRVQINGQRAEQRCCFGAGEYELAFALPADVEDHPLLHVRIWAGTTFVPKQIGLNQDPRHLSVLLRGVDFSNSVTGQRFVMSAVPTLQSGPILWLVVAGIVVLALTLRRPLYGAVALVLTDPFLLAHSMRGTTLTLPKVALVAVALGLIPRLRVKSLSGGKTLCILLGAQILIVLSMLLSSVHATDHGAALRETFKAVQYAGTLIVAYLAYRMDPEETALRSSFSVAAIVVSGLALAQEFFGAPQSEMFAGHEIARIAGPLEGPNQLAGYLGVLVPAMLAFALTRPAFTLERIAIVLGCGACLLTFSKGGIGVLAIAVLVLLAIRYAPQRGAAIAAVSTAVFAVLFVFAGSSFAGAHGSAQNVFGSVDAGQRFNGGLGVRSDLWHAAYALWRSHPLLGIGPGNFELSVGRYDPGVRTHANSMYFQTLAEQGIIGFVAMLAVVAASIGVFVRRLNEPLALGACAAAVAMAFHQIVDCMWIYPKVGVMWWLLLAFGAAAVDLAARSEYVADDAVG